MNKNSINLFTLIHIENMKYRHSIWKVFFFLIPIIPCVIGSLNYQNNIEILKEGWFDLWSQHTLFYSFFFFSPMIAIAASFLWRVEHKGKNWNLFMTSPVSTGKLYAAKLCILLRLIIEIQLFVGILFLVSGKLLHVSGTVPFVILWWLVRGTLGAFVIAGIQMMFSMLIHNFAIPVIIGFLGGISGFLVSNYGYGTFYPYSQLMMGMNSNKTVDILSQDYLTFYTVCIIYFVLFFIVSVSLLKTYDVHTQ